MLPKPGVVSYLPATKPKESGSSHAGNSFSINLHSFSRLLQNTSQPSALMSFSEITRGGNTEPPQQTPACAQPRPTPGYPIRWVTRVQPSFALTPGATLHRDEVCLTILAVGHGPMELQRARAGQNCSPMGSVFPANPGLQVLGCPSRQVYSGTFKRVRQHYMPVALSSQEDQGGCQGSLFLPVLLAQRSRKKEEKTQKKRAMQQATP